MDEPSDLELVQRVRNGHRQAFTELMRRHQQRIYWVARWLVGNHYDADTLAQETFVKAYLSLGDFRNDANFRLWLYRIVVTLSLNAIRKHQLAAYIRDSEILRRLLPEQDGHDMKLESSEDESRFQRGIAELPEKQKVVFVMRFFEGLSYDDISQILKTSVANLKPNFVDAMRKVQEFMKHEA